MPMPKPASDEEHDEFISRCMADETMKDEYPDEKQRYAVCENLWSDRSAPQKQVRMLQPEQAEIRAVEDEVGIARIRGYAALYYDGTTETEYELWPGAVERIMPGAFDRAIEDGLDIAGLFNHDPSAVLGRTSAGTMRLGSDERGLWYEIDLGNTTVAKDVREHLERGDVRGSSFSFAVEKEEWRQESENGRTVEIRELISVYPLYDVGPVTFPAYEATSAGLRAESIQAAREAYERWVAAGHEMRRLARLKTMTATITDIKLGKKT